MSIGKMRIGYVIMIAACACLVYAISSGIRSNLAVLLNPIIDHSTLDYAQLSFVMATGQLIYGLVQPLFAYLALRRSYAFMLTLSSLLMFSGLAATPLCHDIVSMTIFLGVLFHAGTGGTCFGLMMAVATPALGKVKATAVSGFINAGTGVGSVILCPFMSFFNGSFGIESTLYVLSALTLLVIPVSLWLSSRKSVMPNEEIKSEPQDEKKEFIHALHDKTFIVMLISFCCCGFHMSILQTHLYSQFISYGVGESIATLSYSIIGVSTMVGAIICGYCYRFFSLKNVLGSVFLIRAIGAVLFIFFMPKTVFSVIFFGLMMGLSCDATISPTSEIIRNRYGVRMLGILFGCAFIFHQVGSFISSNVAGIIVDTTKSYNLLWCIDIALCLLAAVIVYALREKDSTPSVQRHCYMKRASVS